MTDNSLSQHFHALADKEAANAVSVLPNGVNERFVLFTEALRMVDYWAVFQNVLPPEKRLSSPDLHTIQSGWNLAAAHLLRSLTTPNAFPILESTQQSRSYAMTLLHQFGRSVLMRRAAEMVRYGFLQVEQTGDGYKLRKGDFVISQFLDILEFQWLVELESTIEHKEQNAYNKWALFDLEKLEETKQQTGKFWGRLRDPPLEKWKQPNIESLMLPLIHPWNSGHGIMMGYGATPEVDNHFLAEATELVSQWRNEAGIHPKAQLQNTTGADVTAVAALLISFHLKHVRFALIALKHYPEISIPQSLTIWGPLRDLEQNIADFTAMDVSLVRQALAVITMQPRDAAFLQKLSMPFMPLLISLDNGFVLKPVSSLARNPLISASALSEWRYPDQRDKLSAPREDWMRSEIYGLFRGTRYSCVEGSIRLRAGDRVTTDIDAAILDRTTGELALIQIKWQDFFTNDVRKLRSKASNLARELDAWSQLVLEWLHKHDPMDLAKCLRLGQKEHGSITSVHLFAVSRSAARTQGYGFATTNMALAIANWPQFVRVRAEVGASNRVFSSMHTRLRTEVSQKVQSKPIPFEMTVAGTRFRFEDLWNEFE